MTRLFRHRLQFLRRSELSLDLLHCYFCNQRYTHNMAGVLVALRSLMASHSPPLDALVVPSEDYHQSEYVSARDRRREFISGFTGSAGLALVTTAEARLWTDGRYFLQATQQLSSDWKLMRMGEDPAVDTWMADNLPKNAAVGVDPWCISVESAQRWGHAFHIKKQKIIQTSRNLVDEVWTDRPAAKVNPVFVQPVEFSGRTVSDKLTDLREKLKKENARGILITALDEVAWLYNIRGSDVPYCPVIHAFAIVTLDMALFYVNEHKISPEVSSYMKENHIAVQNYDAVSCDVGLLASGQLSNSYSVNKSPSEISENDASLGSSESRKFACGTIWVDPATCCFALYSKLDSEKVLLQQSPLALAKSLKNLVELDGLKKAHIRDGAAVVQYLVWLDEKVQAIYGTSGFFLEGANAIGEKHMGSTKLTEVSVSDKLEEFRACKENFKGLSFPTISSVGQNAAIIHYTPEIDKCSDFDPESIYLFDSGAQYQDGTTDITRTVHFGKPSAHVKTCYTAVLKGQIALDNSRFPNGTNGHALDILARVPLWQYGLDYRHGTGHGIGSYLNVHEGPQLISFRPQARNVPLQASMTVTDEPGYYEDGNFGIRLENVLVVKEADTKLNFGGKGYLEFEHITWVPYQKKLIDLSLLMREEVDWLNDYHSRCRELLAPHLNEKERAWLERATELVSS